MMVLVKSGGDWADASADLLVIPDGMDVEAQYGAYRQWLNQTYYPQDMRAPKTKYKSFPDWLIENGARVPTDTEAIEFHEP